MPLPIEVTLDFQNQYRDYMRYLAANWPPEVSVRFTEKLLRLLDIIAVQPYLYPKSRRFKSARKCLIDKYMSFYYHVKRDRVQVVALYHHSRQ